MADHLPVFVTLQFKNLNSANVNASKPIFHRVINDRIIAQINKKLLNEYWEFITENTDVNLDYDTFLLLLIILLKIVPLTISY